MIKHNLYDSLLLLLLLYYNAILLITEILELCTWKNGNHYCIVFVDSDTTKLCEQKKIIQFPYNFSEHSKCWKTNAWSTESASINESASTASTMGSKGTYANGRRWAFFKSFSIFQFFFVVCLKLFLFTNSIGGKCSVSNFSLFFFILFYFFYYCCCYISVMINFLNV